jgi:hypothetical protein
MVKRIVTIDSLPEFMSHLKSEVCGDDKIVASVGEYLKRFMTDSIDVRCEWDELMTMAMSYIDGVCVGLKLSSNPAFNQPERLQSKVAGAVSQW